MSQMNKNLITAVSILLLVIFAIAGTVGLIRSGRDYYRGRVDETISIKAETIHVYHEADYQYASDMEVSLEYPNVERDDWFSHKSSGMSDARIFLYAWDKRGDRPRRDESLFGLMSTFMDKNPDEIGCYVHWGSVVCSTLYKQGKIHCSFESCSYGDEEINQDFWPHEELAKIKIYRFPIPRDNEVVIHD